jgi:BA14K-like protein
MRSIMLAAVATAALLSGSLAQAAPVEGGRASAIFGKVQAGEVATNYSQYRSRYYGGPRYYGRSYYGRPYGYYRRDRGNAAAGVLGGLAAGAIIGGAIASQQAQAAPTYVVPNNDAVAYCAQRFRSYDPASGTYLGYDGLRHACP